MGKAASSVAANSIEQRLERLEALMEQAIGPGLNVLSLETNLVWRPGGTGAVNANVFTTWAALLAEIQKINGQIVVTIDTSQAAAVIPAGAASFAGPTGGGPTQLGNGNIRWVGMAANTTLTIADGAIFSGAQRMRFEELLVVFQGNTAAFTVVGGRLELEFSGDALCSLTCSGTADFAISSGAGACTVVASFFGIASLATGKGFSAAGAGAVLLVNTYDASTVAASTLGSSGGATLTARKCSTASSISLTQAGVSGGVLTPGTNLFNTSGLSSTQGSSAFTDATSTVAPVPANQTTPGATTDILAAIVTPQVSGVFLVALAIAASSTAADTVTCTVRTHAKAAAIVVGNGTATGNGCFFATASGAITYGGGTTDATHYLEGVIVPTGSKFTFKWFGIVFGTAGGGGFTLGQNVAFAAAVQNAAHDVTSITGTISAVELAL